MFQQMGYSITNTHKNQNSLYQMNQQQILSNDFPGSYLFQKQIPSKHQSMKFIDQIITDQRLVQLPSDNIYNRIKQEIKLYRIKDQLEKQQTLINEIKEQLQKQQNYNQQRMSQMQKNNYISKFQQEIVSEIKILRGKLRDIEIEKARKEQIYQYPQYPQIQNSLIQQPYDYMPYNPYQYAQSFTESNEPVQLYPQPISKLPKISQKQYIHHPSNSEVLRKNNNSSFKGDSISQSENVSKTLEQSQNQSNINQSQKCKSFTDQEVTQLQVYTNSSLKKSRPINGTRNQGNHQQSEIRSRKNNKSHEVGTSNNLGQNTGKKPE